MWFLALFLSGAWAQMAPYDETCEQGDYAVTGVDNGIAVKLDYAASGLSFGANNETILTLVYDVPSMYFYNVTHFDGTQNVTYNRAVQVTFHDRATGDSGSCYSGRVDSTDCPDSQSTWTVVENGCMSTLTGQLNFDDLMRSDHMDQTFIAVREETMNLNGVADNPTWEIYMDSMIDTWAFYSQVGNGSGEVDSYNGVQQVMPDNHLTIETEMHSYYHIPWRISIPQQIQIVASSIRSSSALVALYAVIVQTQSAVSFNTSTGVFGHVDVTLRTQVQYPFYLLGTDVGVGNGQASISRVTSDQTTQENIDTISWTSYEEGSAACASVAQYDYCEQNWNIRIVPNQCDISGMYQVDFYAECFTQDEGCALNFGNDMFQETSNRWTGIKYFTIEAQEFCPTILDEIHVQGEINAYANSELDVAANPGTNVFVNTHVYFEATYTTTSLKDGVDFGDSSLDDSMIEFVRPYLITMTVDLVTEPLQYDVETANGDVTYIDQGTNGNKKYMVTLCEVDPLGFDYTDPITNCFDAENLGWNAANVLAFGNITTTDGGSNPVDPNEIAFSIRLDERVIPVDHPNDPSSITISIDAEIYYYGVTNPSRRRLTSRRTLQSIRNDGASRSQTNELLFTMPVQRRPVSYCPIKSSVAFTGFHLNMIADPSVLPSQEDASDHVFATRHQLSEYLEISPDKLHVYQVDRCVEEDCTMLFPSTSGELDNSSPNTVSYYVDVHDIDAATKLQNDLYNSEHSLLDSPFMDKKALNTMSLDHCDGELMTAFNDYRLSDNGNDGVDTIEDSGAAMFSFLALSVLALFY